MRSYQVDMCNGPILKKIDCFCVTINIIGMFTTFI